MKITITIILLLSSVGTYAAHIDIQKGIEVDLSEDPVYFLSSPENDLFNGDPNTQVFVSSGAVNLVVGSMAHSDKKPTGSTKQMGQLNPKKKQGFSSLWQKSITNKQFSSTSPKYFSQLTNLLLTSELPLAGLYQLDIGQLTDITDVTIKKMNTFKSALNDLDDLLSFKLYQAMGYLGAGSSFGNESTRFDEALKRDEFFKESLESAGLSNGHSQTTEAWGVFSILYNLPKLLTLTNLIWVLSALFFLSLFWRIFRYVIVRL